MKARLIRIATSTLAGISLLYTSWFIFVYQPDLHHIRRWVQSGHRAAQPILETLYPLALERESQRGIEHYAVHIAFLERYPHPVPQSALLRSGHRALWSLTTHLLLSDDESFGLWVSCAYHGCNAGLPAASERYYAKSINELSLEEQAALVVLVSSPGEYPPGSESSKHAVKALIDRHTGSQSIPN